jgi:hypothetical protein
LTASVVPLTNTISAASFALMNLAIFSLDFSCSSVASKERVRTALCTLALWFS